MMQCLPPSRFPMLQRRRFLIGAAMGVGSMALRGVGAEATKPVRTLIRDSGIRGGFHLIDPKPGKRVPYGRLPGIAGGGPAWDLAQWSSRFPLAAGPGEAAAEGVRRWHNDAKSITLGDVGSPAADFALAVNARLEYAGRPRKSGEPWVHLLVEQSFDDPPSLTSMRSVRLRIQARLLRCESDPAGEADPSLHAAQFPLCMMIQNRNKASKGYGQMVWFVVPLYDSRHRVPREHMAKDTGGTNMFIYHPAGDVFTHDSAHDDGWLVVDKDLRGLMGQSLETAWQLGFTPGSHDISDYRLTGLNLGWEVTGLFDVAMQVSGLELEAVMV
jgi:hypothetical protein